MAEGEENSTTVTVVVPCFNERQTLRTSVERLRTIEEETTRLEIHIVDDGSTDGCGQIAEELSREYANVSASLHPKNRGKGAALRTGFKEAKGDIVAVQDADLEYDPRDLKKMIDLVKEDRADVVVGSRFLTGDAHRVLYFWHSVGNRIITFLSNMLTDLNLTDVEACYKVFKHDFLEDIELCEDRFGIEPEIIAKLAEKRPRIYEVGISYSGRTYEEGKKIGVADGFRALHCILRYNAYRAPLFLQLILFLLFGAVGILLNLTVFVFLMNAAVDVPRSIVIAFLVYASYQVACVNPLLFRKRSRWKRAVEPIVHGVGLIAAVILDVSIVATLASLGISLYASKVFAILAALLYLYFWYRFFVYRATPVCAR